MTEKKKPTPAPDPEPTQAERDAAEYERIQREARERRTGREEL